MTIVTDYTGILFSIDGEPTWAWNTISGAGSPVIVTYSFAEGANLVDWDAQNPDESLTFSSLTEAQRANFRVALSIFEQVCGVIFVEETNGLGMINAMNTAGASYGGSAGIATSDQSFTYSSPLMMNMPGDFDPGSDGFKVLLHELGHTMGLEHPWEGDLTLDPAIDDQAHTVMTYNGAIAPTSTLGSLDIDALQYQYGLASAVAGWDVAMVAGVLTVSGSARDDVMLGALGPCDMSGLRGNDKVFGKHDGDTLNGDRGDDTLSGNAGGDRMFGGAGRDVLHGFGREVMWDEGNDSLYGNGGSDVLKGGFGDDLLVGGAGADRLNGGAGNDSINGGSGDDVLFGDVSGHSVDHIRSGSGADRFVFTDGGSEFYLTDFTRGEDKIDLSAMGIGYGDVVKSGAWLLVGTLWINTTVTAAITEADFLF